LFILQGFNIQAYLIEVKTKGEGEAQADLQPRKTDTITEVQYFHNTKKASHIQDYKRVTICQKYIDGALLISKFRIHH
jgi:hypothetical protein